MNVTQEEGTKSMTAHRAPRADAFDSAQERALREQEAEDLATLLREQPVESGGCVWWCFARRPAPCEMSAEAANAVVVVSATAQALRLRIERQYVRRVDGEPVSLDRKELSEQLRTGKCVVSAVPSSHIPPETGLTLRVSLALA